MQRFHPGARKAVSFSRHLLFTTVFGLASSLATAADYQLIDLGANVTPRDINSSGEIAGARNTDQYPNIAFRWTASTGFDDLNGTSANAINDAGKIAGSTVTGAFVLDGNSMKSWTDHTAYGINELGNVSGSQAGRNPYRETSIPYNPAVLEGNKWTVMDIAKVYPRGTRDGVYADIYNLKDISETGVAVGSRHRYGLAGSSAIVINPPYSDILDLTYVVYLPTGGVANAINAQELIVGTSGSDSRNDIYATAFLYDGVDANYLGTLAGGLSSGAYDINDFSEVVGYSQSTYGNRAFVWDETTGMRDLNELVATTGWILTAAYAINNAGDIVGIGTLDGKPHGFLLTTGTLPPPPPVVNHAPVAVATSDVSSGKVSLSVNFSAADSSDPDGDTMTYSWDFGDGTTSTEMIPPTHVYSTVDTFIVVLTVTDDGGMTGSDQMDITVRKSNGRSK